MRIFAQCQSDTLRVVSTTFIPFQRQLFFRRVQTFRGRENPVKVVETIGNFFVRILVTIITLRTDVCLETSLLELDLPQLL